MAPGGECYRLIKHWEKGPAEVNGVPWPRSVEGAALKAYKCSAGKWTISFGVRWHPDGRPVVEGDTITEADVMPYLEAAMGRVASDVRRAFDIQLTQNQFDAITVWIYNLGIGRMKGELKDFINQGRTSDAAAEMCTYVYATTQASDGYPWKRAMRGLLIRRLTESCVWMGYDWEEACEPDGIALPTKRRFEPEWADPETGKKGRYYDDIQVGKTKLSDTLYKAQNYPLELVLNTPAPPLATRVPEAAGAGPTPQPSPASVPVPKVSPAPSVVPTSPAKKPEAVPAPPAQPPRVPPPPPLPVPVGQQTNAVDAARKSEEWSNSAKSMIFSRRFWGLFLVVIGRLWMLKTGSNAVLGAVSDPIVTEMFSGFMVMMLGEIVQRYGERKATRPLR